VHNAVIVTTSATDVTFDPVAVENTTAGDPLNITGPLGYCAVDYTSANLRNSDQAHAAGKQQLMTQLGQAKQLTLEAISNPALDAEDVIEVKLPTIDRNTGRPSELQIVEQVTHPLLQGDEGGSPNAQQILTRSTRPDTDGA
jgi:hypothetical protein